MSILIKGLDAPKDCLDCLYTAYNVSKGSTFCRITGNVLAEGFDVLSEGYKPKDCPVTSVPPHGSFHHHPGRGGRVMAISNRLLIKLSMWLYKKAGGNGLPALPEMPDIKAYQLPPPVKMRVRDKHQCQSYIPEEIIKQRMAAKLAADLVKTQLVTFDAESTEIGNTVLYTMDILIVPPRREHEREANAPLRKEKKKMAEKKTLNAWAEEIHNNAVEHGGKRCSS